MLIEWNENITLPKYRELYHTEADIILLWGGRLSGKSRNIPHIVIRDILQHDKSKVVLVREVFETIKESIYAEFDDFIENNDFYSHGLFTRTKTPLEIHCSNGSKILTRGCDNPNKIKSIKEPDTFIIEEADQISEQAFDFILTTARSSKKKVKIYLLFNPEFNINGNWIEKRFFNQELLKGQDMYGHIEYTMQKEIDFGSRKEIIDLKILAIHSTWRDNQFASSTQIAVVESFKDINYNKWKVWSLGHWGQAEVDKPYIPTFDKSKHVITSNYNNDTIYLSFDFNVDPITCIAGQKQGNEVNVIEEFVLRNSDIYELCEHIKIKLPKSNYLMVTGDATGKNRQAISKGGITYYQVIRDILRLSDSQFLIPSVNHSNLNSRELMSRAFHLNKCNINNTCTYLINDLTYCEVGNDGKLLKKNNGADKQLSHLMDCLKYLLINFFKADLKLD